MIADRLIHLRKAAKLQQKELAEKLGVAPNTYNGYETGKRKPDLEMATKIAQFFDVSVDYLLGNSRDPHLTEQQDYLVSFEALKEWRDRIKAGQVIDIPEDRIPFIVDYLDKEIMIIEQKLKEQK